MSTVMGLGLWWSVLPMVVPTIGGGMCWSVRTNLAAGAAVTRADVRTVPCTSIEDRAGVWAYDRVARLLRTRTALAAGRTVSAPRMPAWAAVRRGTRIRIWHGHGPVRVARTATVLSDRAEGVAVPVRWHTGEVAWLAPQTVQVKP